MATGTQQRGERALDVPSFDTPQDAQAHLIGSPALVVAEARESLRLVRETCGDIEASKLVDLVEPLARCIGWVEACAFMRATDPSGQRLDTMDAISSSS